MALMVTGKSHNMIIVKLLTHLGSQYTEYAYYRNGSWQGQSDNTSYTFSGLSPSTTYTLSARAYNSNTSNWEDAGSITETTNPDPDANTPPPKPSIPVVNSRIDAGFIMSWAATTRATGYEFSYRTVGGSWSTTTTTSTSSTITGRPYGTGHEFRLRAYNSYGYSPYSDTSSATTAPQTPIIKAGKGGIATSIVVEVGGVTGGFTDITVDRLTTTNQFLDSRTTSVNGGSVTWLGLVKGQKYNFRARSRYFINGTDLFSVNYSNTITLTVGGNRPEDFQWVYSDVTSQAFRQGGNADYAIDHRDWTALQDRINEFREYKNLLPITFTRVFRNTPVSSSAFNIVRNIIVTLEPPNMPTGTKSQGDPIVASDISGLRYSLNSVQ